MERLTKKIAGSVALPLIPMDIKNKEDLEIYHKVRKQYEENTIKLAEYEDFEEIFRAKMTDTACEFLKDKEEFGKWLDRNRWITKKCDEWVRAEEQGLLLRLPTEAYFIKDNKMYKGWVQEVVYSVCRKLLLDIRYDDNSLDSYRGYVGNTVFLTQAEAEHKLKEMESE